MLSIKDSFNQFCHQIEHTEGKLDKTDVTELQILREHTDYLSVIGVHKDTVFSASGDMNIYLHRFPTGKQHYDMLRTQERNSVAVLYQVTAERSKGLYLLLLHRDHNPASPRQWSGPRSGVRENCAKRENAD